MQWEIFDALEDTAFDTLNYFPIHHVAGPQDFAEDDMPNLDGLVQFLNQADPAVEALYGALRNQAKSLDEPNVASILKHKNRLVAHLNGLLGQREFHRETAFRDLELADLRRPGFGVLGVEHRDFPGGEGPLRHFQARRVNRLIIEAICQSKSLLRRGGYLSTQGVLDRILQLVRSEGREISRVIIYAHPAHFPRCRRQFLESAWCASWGTSKSDVLEGAPDDGSWTPLWSADCAQEWCKNEANWKEYESFNLSWH